MVFAAGRLVRIKYFVGSEVISEGDLTTRSVLLDMTKDTDWAIVRRL